MCGGGGGSTGTGGNGGGDGGRKGTSGADSSVASGTCHESAGVPWSETFLKTMMRQNAMSALLSEHRRPKDNGPPEPRGEGWIRGPGGIVLRAP